MHLLRAYGSYKDIGWAKGYQKSLIHLGLKLRKKKKKHK